MGSRGAPVSYLRPGQPAPVPRRARPGGPCRPQRPCAYHSCCYSTTQRIHVGRGRGPSLWAPRPAVAERAGSTSAPPTTVPSRSRPRLTVRGVADGRSPVSAGPRLVAGVHRRSRGPARGRVHGPLWASAPGRPDCGPPTGCALVWRRGRPARSEPPVGGWGGPDHGWRNQAERPRQAGQLLLPGAASASRASTSTHRSASGSMGSRERAR